MKSLEQKTRVFCQIDVEEFHLRPLSEGRVLLTHSPEYNGRLGGGVNMRGGQTTVGHDTLGRRPAEDPDEGQLAGTAGHGLCIALGGGGGRLDGEVDAVLDNVAGGG